MGKQLTKYIYTILVAFTLLSFQNCGQPGSIAEDPGVKARNIVDVCSGVSCDLEPLTDKPAITTILLALGDEANQQLVVNGGSAQLIAETVIRYSSPKKDPRILLVQDQNIQGEDPEDTAYVKDVLLKRYSVVYMMEPINGLTDQDVRDFDVVWFNNPGYPMSSINTRDTLIRFKGAVVLQGDDLSQGTHFSLTELTGLNFVDNGSTVTCNGIAVNHNDNSGEQYHVGMDSSRFANTDPNALQFRYGNDIDLTTVANNNVEVLATAKGGPATCTELRPAIVRHFK